MKISYRVIACCALLLGAVSFTLSSCGGGGGGNSGDKGLAPSQFLPSSYTSCEVKISVPQGEDTIELSFTCQNSTSATQGVISSASIKGTTPNWSGVTGTWQQTNPTSYNRISGLNLICHNFWVADMNMSIQNSGYDGAGVMTSLSGVIDDGTLTVHPVGGDASDSSSDSYYSLANSTVTITYTPIGNNKVPDGGDTSGGDSSSSGSGN